MRGDAEESKREIGRLFSARGGAKGGKVQGIAEENGRRVLKVEKVEVYGSKAFALMDSGAVPNVFSKVFVQRLSLVPRETHKNITVATGTKSPVVGILTEVPVKFGDLVVNLYFLVVDGSPFDVIVGDPAMEELKGVIDLGNRQVRLTKEQKKVLIPL